MSSSNVFFYLSHPFHHLLLLVFLLIRLLETAKRLIAEAEKYYRLGDEEMAYVFYTKYFSLLNIIYKKRDYIESKPLIRQMLGDNRSNKMTMDRLEMLTRSLNERYDRLNTKKLEKRDCVTPLNRSSLNSSLNQERSRSNSPKVTESNGFPPSLRLMTSQELFECMKTQNVLIMDCRPADDYKMSHLTYPLAFNVPQELIQYG